MSGLDETIVDPLSAVERDALTQLREHDSAVSALRDDIAGLQQRSSSGAASMAELRRLAKEAERVEGLVGAPREVLSRDALVEAGWPAAALAQARMVLSAVDDCEAATSAARDQIKADGNAGECEDPKPLHNALDNLLGTWTKLEETEASMKRCSDLPASKVDLMMEARASAISPLCAALLDKTAGIYSELKSKPEEEANPEWLSFLQENLTRLLTDEAPKRALESLQVELPSSDLLEGILGPVEASPVSTAPAGSPMAASMMIAEKDISPSHTAGDAAAAATAAVDAAIAAMDNKEGLGSATKPRMESPFGIGAGLATGQMQDQDPMSCTVPAAPSIAKMQETVSDAAAAGQAQGGSRQRYVVPAPSGSAELWHAVHVGDEAAVQRYAAAGACDGAMRDASGHSVFWHAIAFNHLGLANFMLDNFPPGAENGIDLSEVHARKGDNFLHLLCQSKQFGTDTAHLFKRVASSVPTDIFLRPNQAGLTFFQIAASQLNFWVLTFVLKNFHDRAKALVCSNEHAALRNMSEVVPQPSLPAYTPPVAFPDHFHVAEMLQQDDTGSVPYADVAFDVGPESLGNAAGRFLAHRIIVASMSPILMQELNKLPFTHLSREDVHAVVFRVDPRISKEVWRSALQFMYTGVINVSYTADAYKMVELFRACVLYQLPKPLLEFAQSCLYPLLPNSPPSVSLQVFSICAGTVAGDVDLTAARECSTYILLRGAHKLFEGMDAKEVCQILEKVVQSVEKTVFAPKAASNQQHAGGAAAEAAAAGAAPQADPAAMAQGMLTGPPTAMPQSPWMMQASTGMDRMAYSMGSTQDVQAYQEMMSRRSQGVPEMMPPEAYQEMMAQRGAPDMLQHSLPYSQSGYAQQDMMSQSMRSSQDMMSQSTRSPQDMMSQSMRGPQDMLSQSMRSPQDMYSQSGRASQDMLSQSMPPGMMGMQDPRAQMQMQMQDPRMQMQAMQGGMPPYYGGQM